MKNLAPRTLIAKATLLLLAVMIFLPGNHPVAAREFNGPYSGENLAYVNFPIGGIGAGMFCLEGTGAITQMSVKHHMEFFNTPYSYAAITVLNNEGKGKNTARVLEGPLASWKYFGIASAANGLRERCFGLPRFHNASFLDRFPFATIDLSDGDIPLQVRVTGWSPFTPGDADSSSLPVGALEYTFTNTSNETQKAVFSFNTENFLDRDGSIGSIPGGFVLYANTGDDREQNGAFAFFVDGEKVVDVDHCWFRGGWFDPNTVTWRNVEMGAIPNNPPVPSNAPGASLAVPFTLKPGETRTVRLLAAWYVPKTKLKQGTPAADNEPAFAAGPSKGTTPQQQSVSGFLGQGLVNSFDPHGDGPTGTLTSPEFTIDKKYLHFLVGGGQAVDTTCVNVLVGNKQIFQVTGTDTEGLNWATCDLSQYQGQKATIQIVDRMSGNWGHILADEFILSDESLASLKSGEGNAILPDASKYEVLADFEGKCFGKWIADPKPAQPKCDPTTGQCASGACCSPKTPEYYVPWYATQFHSIQQVAQMWKDRYDELRQRSETFRDTFYDSTLPPEVIEAVAANLAILKTPTVLRQHDGRLWCWEGCCDGSGCCSGSCTHVWNYAQALCHLFPSLERSLRQTEFNESQSPEGHQTFRANLPISPTAPNFHAASDGQLGGIMKFYRDWTISGNDAWLKQEWPKVKTSLDYMIRTWDPRHTGLLEEEHHNTYDINYFGPDGHCGSFYLGALAAAIEMGKAVGDDVTLYEALLEKGKKRMVDELFNGEYFIQIIQKSGLDHNYQRLDPNQQSQAYCEMAEKISDQGPKYQYGNGCLSDGVLGLWMAKVCGLDQAILDDDLVQKHLKSVHKYNLKKDLSQHANPQRPTFAMGNDGGLLLCTWPHGDALILPFVYSNEVWTGIEYQVASHLMILGRVDEGLDIVRACRKRYDGTRRNPFDEYECGHYYARAMSSYGLLQGLTGVRYDARTKTLYVDSKIGDFRSFLSTETGFGVVELKDGKATVDVRYGSIPVKKTIVGSK